MFSICYMDTLQSTSSLVIKTDALTTSVLSKLSYPKIPKTGNIYLN